MANPVLDLHWDPRYCVGHPLLDEQHQVILALCGRAQAMARTNDLSGTAAFIEFLHQLVDYTCTHFRAEEEILAELGYADLDAHRKAHQDYEEVIAEILAAATRGLVKRDELFRFVAGWWLRHIVDEDQLYSPWTNEMDGDASR